MSGLILNAGVYVGVRCPVKLIQWALSVRYRSGLCGRSMSDKVIVYHLWAFSVRLKSERCCLSVWALSVRFIPFRSSVGA